MELGRRNVVSSPTPGVGLRIDDRYVSPRLSGQQTQVPEDLSMLGSDGTLRTFGLRTPQAGVATETAQTGNGVEAALERLTDPLRSVRLRQFRGEVSQEELLREDIRESLLPAENLPTSGEAERLLEELKRVPLESAQPKQLSLWQEQLRRARRQERDTTDSANSGDVFDSYEFLQPRYRDVLRREKRSEIYQRRQEESDRDLQDSLGRERDATPQEILDAIRTGQGNSRFERSYRANAGQQAHSADAILEQIGQTLDRMGEGGGAYVWSGGSGDGRGQASYRERARAIMGPYQSIESYTEAKFRKHMVAGEVYLEQGKYYRAASAYNMALVYEPDDVSALVGRSHALFAAGEYMSSALFLSRALEALRTEDQQVNVAEQLGVWGERLSLIDRDKLDSRLVDLEKWQKENDSPELRFLAGYVYHQTGRNIEAKKAMAEAARRMPGAEAVITLKNVVDSKQ
jgi:tetratricopeptide (TPR) repeat protein